MRRLSLLAATCLVVVLSACSQQAAPLADLEPAGAGDPSIRAAATSSDLFFSEYVEGSSNNKALEIYNGTGTPVDLAAGGYSVQMFFNGNTAAGQTIDLTGTIADGDVFVLANSGAAATILAAADQTDGAGWFNGDDAVVLRRGGVLLDAIGQVGFDPGSQWGSDLTSTADNTLRRLPSVCAGDPDGSDAFDPTVGWAGFATDTFDGLGVHPTPTCQVTLAPPALNEFVANHIGSDTHEYVEVFGTAVTDYAAYTILQIEGDTTGAGTVDAALSIGTTNAEGLWTTGFLGNVLENGTLTLLLVDGFTGAVGDDLDTNDDGTFDTTPWLAVVDAVAVSDGGTGDLTYAGAGVVLTPDADGGSFAYGGASRLPDGVGDWVRNDFDLAGIDGFPGSPVLGEALNTPGALNAVVVADPCTLGFTPTYAIQGSGLAAAITGDVTTRGVVVGDFEGPSPTLRGFYLQDPDGDGDPATSDGLFVFNGNADVVDVGDLVVVTGSAGEYQGQTQVSASSVTVCDTAASVEPVDVSLPVPNDTYLERFEGMLVRFPQTLVVTELYQLGRFGQVTLSVDERLPQPTNVVFPGAAADEVQAQNDLARIIIDDDTNDQNPDPIVFGRNGDALSATNTLRGGDTTTGATGVLTYTWGGNGVSPNAYRVRPLGALGGGSPEFVATNPRSGVVDVAGGVRVATLNVLNYFTTLNSRGADTPEELERQAAKIVATIVELDADVVGLLEIENGTDALADLVARLNAATAPGTYAAIETGTIGSDEIMVALVYQPERIAALGGFAVLDDTFDPAYRDAFNRPALAQTFGDAAGPRAFTVVVHHLKSKGSDCDDIGDADAGDGQGNCNGTRTGAVEVMLDWLATDPTGSGDPDVLVIGDLNAYALEDPIQTLVNAGYVDLQPAFAGPELAYTYVFDGQWGSLDHALASPTLITQVAGAAAWHTNADEPSVLDYDTDFKEPGQVSSLYDAGPFRASDHDPLLVGLDLDAAPTCSDAVVAPATLWPPRHKFVSVTVGGVTDAEGDAISVDVTSVFQDEPVDAPGDADGSTAPDAAGLGSATVDLRAERDDRGNGRVYHVAFRATDANGQTCAGTVLVSVPRSQGRNGAAVDDGPLYDATLD